MDPLRGHTEAILAKIVRQRDSSGQTESRNMAATHFFQLSDPDFLFDPQYIRGSISHHYGATPRSCYHCAIVKASGNAKYSKSRRRYCQLRAHIARNGAAQALASPSARGDGPRPRYRTAGTVLGADMAARNRTSGFTEPEVV